VKLLKKREKYNHVEEYPFHVHHPKIGLSSRKNAARAPKPGVKNVSLADFQVWVDHATSGAGVLQPMSAVKMEQSPSCRRLSIHSRRLKEDVFFSKCRYCT